MYTDAESVVDSFAATLMVLPLVPDLIADAVYAHSKTLDGRHFAQEFVRRKQLADKGVVEKQPSSSPSVDGANNKSGGWNEVAKKTSNKEAAAGDAHAMQGTGFKVVPGRSRKGKK